MTELKRSAAFTRNAAFKLGTPLKPSVAKAAPLKVAFVHYWLVGMRGGEKVLEALCRMFPQADIFTHVYDPRKISPLIRGHKVTTSSIAKLPMATKMYTKYVSKMPRALEELDLTGYDLVISSESGPAKGVITPPEALHLSYVHSPMRYIWDHYGIYRSNADPVTRHMMSKLSSDLRTWDVVSAARVDGFAANSRFVQNRIEKYWRRESCVIHPPVDVAGFSPDPNTELGSFYLYAGELTSYKRPDLAVEAFTELGLPLVVIGGPDKAAAELAKTAGRNVRFLGRVSDEKLKRYFAACRALIFPGEEDFGILPVEVMAAGRPVIAYGKGGALDTVVDGETGSFFESQTVASLVTAVETFEREKRYEVDTAKLISHAQRFDEETFRAGMIEMLAAYGIRPEGVARASHDQRQSQWRAKSRAAVSRASKDT